MNGRNSIVVSSPNSKALTLSVVAAMIGSASWVMALPKTETVSAVHSLRKSGWRSRLRLGAVMDAESTVHPGAIFPGFARPTRTMGRRGRGAVCSIGTCSSKACPTSPKAAVSMSWSVSRTP